MSLSIYYGATTNAPLNATLTSLPNTKFTTTGTVLIVFNRGSSNVPKTGSFILQYSAQYHFTFINFNDVIFFYSCCRYCPPYPVELGPGETTLNDRTPSGKQAIPLSFCQWIIRNSNGIFERNLFILN